MEKHPAAIAILERMLGKPREGAITPRLAEGDDLRMLTDAELPRCGGSCRHIWARRRYLLATGNPQVLLPPLRRSSPAAQAVHMKLYHVHLLPPI